MLKGRYVLGGMGVKGDTLYVEQRKISQLELL